MAVICLCLVVGTHMRCCEDSLSAVLVGAVHHLRCIVVIQYPRRYHLRYKFVTVLNSRFVVSHCVLLNITITVILVTTTCS